VERELDPVLHQALTNFSLTICGGGWRGRREREAVSCFAFGHLVPLCRPGQVLHHPGQIGLEVAVPGIGEGKSQVCKDVVVWREPGAVCWDITGAPTVAPLAILEWKCHTDQPRPKHSSHDIKWLTAFTTRFPDTAGYLVRLNLTDQERTLAVATVRRGVVEDWLTLTGAA
jgi:hypothetical protein